MATAGDISWESPQGILTRFGSNPPGWLPYCTILTARCGISSSTGRTNDRRRAGLQPGAAPGDR
jgi:hypothetical protein